MEIWIARDRIGLWAFDVKPIKVEEDNFYTIPNGNFKIYELDEEMFPEVTCENSPRKIKIEFV